MTAAVASSSVFAKRAIRRRRRTKRAPARFRVGTLSAAELTRATADHPARRPEIVPVPGVRLEVEAGAEEDDVQEHREQPQPPPRPGSRGEAWHRAFSGRARLAVHGP